MERDRERKHRCKVCRMFFPCGRSLGGHMRSHMSAGNSSSDVDDRPSGKRSLAVGVGTAYGLRENPKKTWRLSDSAQEPPLDSEKQCRECGKCFQSWKALFGHMRCHSEKSQHSLGGVKEKEEDEKLGLDNLSDNDVMVPRRSRSRQLVALLASSSSTSSGYESELEEAAIALLILSRDTRDWAGTHMAVYSQDDSMVLVDKHGNGKKPEMESKGSELEFLREGYPRNGLNKIDSVVADNGFVKDDDELKKPDAYASDTDVSEDLGYDFAEMEAKPRLVQCDSRKRERFGVTDIKLLKESSPRLEINPPEKRSRYECSACKKSFNSYQALGGHRAGHRRYGCLGVKTDGSEDNNSMERDMSSVEKEKKEVEEMMEQSVSIGIHVEAPNKGKSHVCLICGKDFASGQALGGHKRAHLAGTPDGQGIPECLQTIVIQQQQPSEIPDLLDLNIPASGDEDSVSKNSNAELKQWWLGSDLEREPLIDLVAN